MPKIFDADGGFVVSHAGIILKEFPVHGISAQKYIDRLTGNPEFLQSEIERVEKIRENYKNGICKV